MKETFVINDYGKKPTFASFLPGISGLRGIPIWCYYVNRGQGIVSFGVDNKDHSIMEFYPAHSAYQNVKTTGFRTFYRVNKEYFEAFSNEEESHFMEIGMNHLGISEENKEHQIKTEVEYYTLPGERIGALVRRLKVTNLSEESVEVEVLDGMPELIPYGVNLGSVKDMLQTSKAWMQVEDTEGGIPYFRVRASMEDSASVQAIEGGNFSYGCLDDGVPLAPIVDPEAVFAYDTSLREAKGFQKKGLDHVFAYQQMTTNILPCSFYGTKKILGSQESFHMYQLIGQVERKEILMDFFGEYKSRPYFEAKKKEAQELVEEVCKGIKTETASKEFDNYCQYTYMDNVLRGGLPMQLGNNKIFYAYSRKHGDLERDYNYFSMLPEFYSQGNGNFRDVNQNRRCDTFFAPFVGRENIHAFYNFIQTDGYNPLAVEKITYQLSKERALEVLEDVAEEECQELLSWVTKPFTPGALYAKLEDVMKDSWSETLFYQIIDFSDSLVNANFGEGYWSDHWTYNLDLIEDYLEIYPDKEENMLFEKTYTYFLSQAKVNKRAKRYVLTPNGVRQYHAIDETSLRNTKDKLLRLQGGKGEIGKTTLMEKLILLCAMKYATLDAYGMGVEMEGGKPGWYDALNGMPGLFGSSMAETYELARMLTYVINALEKYPRKITLYEELAKLLKELYQITLEERDSLAMDEEVLSFWNQINDVKEAYRDQVYDGITGQQVSFESQELVDLLKSFLAVVNIGIEKAIKMTDGICPTYFTYEVTMYKTNKKSETNEEEQEIIPLRFEPTVIPYFLEGPVRYLKLEQELEAKKSLYEKIKDSDLYDEKLHMYKVNASLSEASYELGRAKAFTPGWLENESIWLHMEYKYLLELLRSGMYKEFFGDFKEAAVPFLDPEVYGRSIYENSSFIASSKNPNKNYHGKGFVARLSGSTIEFISMWKFMMFGAKVFSVEKGELIFSPQPAFASYLVPEHGMITATLLGDIQVEYHLPKVTDYIPGEYQIENMVFHYKNNSVANVNGKVAKGKLAQDIREKMIEKIEIRINI